MSILDSKKIVNVNLPKKDDVKLHLDAELEDVRIVKIEKSNIIDFQSIEMLKSQSNRGFKLKKSSFETKYQNDMEKHLKKEEKSKIISENKIVTYARQLFPHGKEVKYNKNVYNLIEQTKNYIQQDANYIYNATFIYEGIVVVVDILKIEKSKVSIYEISKNTEVNNTNIESLSLQYHVLKQLGYNIKTQNVMYINDTYVRGSFLLDFEELFSIKNVRNEILTLEKKISKNLKDFQISLKDVKIVKDLESTTNEEIIDKSIFSLFKFNSQKQLSLYEKGIIDIANIPDDFSLTSTQKKIVQVYKTNNTFVDEKKINEFLNTISYPIYHLNINTYTSAIPEFEDVSPYQKIPFEYSLHIEHKDGSIEHVECLCDNLVDPRYEVAKQLCKDIPLDATVLTYDKDIIEDILRNLAFPYNGRSLHLMNMVKNLKDLKSPFQKNHYISPLQNVNCDFKSVCFALIPELVKEEKLLKNDCEFNTLSSIEILKVLKKHKIN